MPIEPGLVLFGEGQAADAWWVLLDGTIELVRHIGREDTVVAKMDVAGRWAGGFRAWDENGTYLATGRGSLPGRVFRLPAEVLRDRFAEWFPFGAHLIGGVYHTARSIESDRAPAQLVDHPGHPGRRPGARAQQPGLGRHPRRRRPGRRQPGG